MSYRPDNNDLILEHYNLSLSDRYGNNFDYISRRGGRGHGNYREGSRGIFPDITTNLSACQPSTVRPTLPAAATPASLAEEQQMAPVAKVPKSLACKLLRRAVPANFDVRFSRTGHAISDNSLAVVFLHPTSPTARDMLINKTEAVSHSLGVPRSRVPRWRPSPQLGISS
ncbi:hypothetical protein FIE12Z_6829 [Fusarium flagelliforme]|uniref:Uncharacterized protein n=1 Tax=Fusarium flagelliforme TaxID=2675880 RepID=A0A395MM36_9HYPO|nr:hypothetical protein FIE12Z_6829 [Fusarium flagelliforme]